MPGGSIRNIVLASALLAAADGGVVTMQHLFGAAHREYQKTGELLTGSEFGEHARLSRENRHDQPPVRHDHPDG